MKKILSIFVAALFSATMFGASGVDWSTIEFLGDGAGGGAYTNKYKASTADGLTVINIQKPDWAAEAGIYAHVPAGITDCSVASTLQGAGLIMHLSAFTAQETEVTINYAGGSCKFWVYYADGTAGEGGGDEGGETTGVPTNEELWEAFKPYYNTFYGLSRADQTIDKVSTFANAKMQEIMTSATSEYKWLGDYILSVATAAGVTLPTDMAEANEGAWRWAVHAFFNAEAGQHGATGIDFTEAGKPEAWGPAYLAAQGGDEGGEDPTPNPDSDNLFDASKASIKETYFAPNWAQETNSSATYDATAGTITVDLKSQFYGQWQAQVKLQHNVVFSAEKQYTISCKFHANTTIGGITLKMDDNAEVVMENQTINLVANETLNYTSKPGNGVEGNNQIIVFDFGWAVPAQVTISDITIKEVGGAVAPPEVEHPAAAPAPTRDAAQVFSIYSDVYTTTVTRGMGGWGQTTREEEVQLAEGDKAFYYSTCNYLGWELNGNTTIGDLTAYPMLHMDVYVAEAGSIGFTPIWGGEAEKAYALQPGWNALDINLTADFVGINLANIFQLKWANMPATCYIDNVYFYGESTDVENITVENTATKVIENGQLIIIRNGVKFDATGKMMK